LPISFVPQEDLPEGTAYEQHIGATGGVPTRDNLHDFFNGLVWLTFPRIKVQLNALQAAQIALDGVGKSRGPARDGATIFDENAALLVVRDNADSHALVMRCASTAGTKPSSSAARSGARMRRLAVRPRADGKAGGAAQGHHGTPASCGQAMTSSRWTTPAPPLDRRHRAQQLAEHGLSTAGLHAHAGTGCAGLVAAAGCPVLCRYQRVPPQTPA
jgi:hypothetical protein